MKLEGMLRLILVMAVTVSLAACGGGGGGGGDSPPSAPVLSLAVQSIKTFHFTWASTGGTTEYRLLENPDSSTGYTVVATLPGTVTSYDQVVFLPGRINASYILRACNSQGCTDSAPVHVTGNLSSGVGYFKPFNAEEGGAFGYSVALSADGNTLAVGALSKPLSEPTIIIDGHPPDTPVLSSGAVYVYTRTGATWSQQAFLKASNYDAGDQFGCSIALSADGNTLAVGALAEASSATGINGNQEDNSAYYSGAVYVYTRIGATWSQQAYVKASNTHLGDLFGCSIALSADGNTLAAGAPGNGNQADNSAPYSGAVYVYTRTGATWSQQAYVKASNAERLDGFGYSVALSADANTLAVGALGEAGYSGTVYVYTRIGATWSQQAYVKASNTDSDDLFGYSIALSADGNTLAVGANWEDSNAIGINGNQEDNSAVNSGAVYVYTRSGATWSQQAYVKASNTDLGDNFGYSIALSADGNTLAVGATWEASNATGINGNQADNSAALSGAVYVYTRSGATWSQQAYVKASNTDPGDYFGCSIALSADGNALAVGATGESSNATGINGNQADNSVPSTLYSGAVYLY